jgi:hypothetical protein
MAPNLQEANQYPKIEMVGADGLEPSTSTVSR